MNKRKRLCIIGVLCLFFFGLGLFELIGVAADSLRPRALTLLTSMAFYCSGLIGFLEVSAVWLMNSRWFKTDAANLKAERKPPRPDGNV